MATPAPAPVAHTFGRPYALATRVVNNALLATGQSSPENRIPTPATAKRVNWDSKLGRVVGYEESPTTREGLVDPLDSMLLFQSIQSRFKAEQQAQVTALEVMLSQEEETKRKSRCSVDADKSHAALSNFRRSVGKAAQDDLSFPGCGR